MRRQAILLSLRQLWIGQKEESDLTGSYWLTRFVFLRALGFIYLIAFFSLSQQIGPLLGKRGLLPAHLHLDRVMEHYGSGWSVLWHWPTLFWVSCTDTALAVTANLGVVLAFILMAG